MIEPAFLKKANYIIKKVVVFFVVGGGPALFFR